MSNATEQIDRTLYPILSKCFSGLAETKVLMNENADSFKKEIHTEVDQLITSTCKAMGKVISDVNSQLGEDHKCKHYQRLTSLMAWINTELPTDKTVTFENVVELVRELLSNASVQDVE
ncbi:MAG: hypothetical protein ACXABY_11040 [Candidatus Thorarchaeota archaeon]|jgi:hypothetical protein